MVLTKAQREFLFKLFRRDFPSWLPFRQNSIARTNRVTPLVDSLPDSGSLAPVADSTGPTMRSIYC
jgi:hypothetical protein